MKKAKETNKSLFVKNLIARRAELGWSAEKLAEEAGIPYPTLRDIEAGISGGRHETKAALALAVNSTIDELSSLPTVAPLPEWADDISKELQSLHAKLDKFQLNAEEAELLRLFRLLNPAVRHVIFSTFDKLFTGMTVKKPKSRRVSG